MRARPALTAVVTVVLLALAGCVGTGADTAASPSSEEATGSDGNATDAQPSLNLTVEVAGANATWRVAPAEDLPRNVTVVEVFVEVKGTVTVDGALVGDGDVAGETAVTIRGAWGACPHGCDTGERPHPTRRASYEATTGEDGGFSATLGPMYFEAFLEPPLLGPYCEGTHIRTWGNLTGAPGPDRDDPEDQDEVRWEVCTQSYL